MHKQPNATQHASLRSPITVFMAMAALAVGLTVAVPATAQVAPLVNGNFEGTPQSNPYTNVVAGNYISGSTGWKVTAGSIDIGTAPAQTRYQFTGTHCVDLNG